MALPLLALALAATAPPGTPATAAPDEKPPAAAVPDKPSVSVTQGELPDTPQIKRKRVVISGDNLDLSGAGTLDFTGDAAPVVAAQLPDEPVTEGSGVIVFNNAGRAIACDGESGGSARKAEEALCKQIITRARFRRHETYVVMTDVARLGFTMRMQQVLAPRRPIVIGPGGRDYPVTVVATGGAGMPGCSILGNPFSEADRQAICAAWIRAKRPGLPGTARKAAAAGPRKSAAAQAPKRGAMAQFSVPLGKKAWTVTVRERPLWRDVDLVYPYAPTHLLTMIREGEGLLKSSIDNFDYPMLALRESMAGKVSALVGFVRDGSVWTCRLLTSSGNAYLDNATCDVITRRVRFEFNANVPKFMDQRYYVVSVRWILPLETE
ncbi:MAG: energy transducer TonB [Novosphingobium sp.]|uniref:energy transducer TonB n=1 Tax=Novosphingobium sp. TaxID=1874826 RepID=UPI003015ECFA